MDTRKLWRNGDFIIVNAGSPKETALLAESWGLAPENTAGHTDHGGQHGDENLNEMTVAELREHAKAHGIQIPATSTTKAAILEVIGSAEAAKSGAAPTA